MLEWEPLADALRRVVGVAIEVAKKEICDHVSQDLIRVRVLPKGSEHFITGSRAVSVPQLLRPSDLDWARSRPKKPWRINFSRDQWGWEFHKIARLELSTFDTQWKLCDMPEGVHTNEAGVDTVDVVPKPQANKISPRELKNVVSNYINTERAAGRKPTQDGVSKAAQSKGIRGRKRVQDAFKDLIDFELERGRPKKTPKE